MDQKQAVSVLKKIGAAAADITPRAGLSVEARNLLGQKASPADFIAKLIEAGHSADAIRFLSHALPKREAVWWACLAVRRAYGGDLAVTSARALDSAEAWVRSPTEEKRRTAGELARSSGHEDPASWAALGAFWSGGSMTPIDAPPVAPADHLTHEAVAGAILLAAAKCAPTAPAPLHREIIEDGLDIARGGSGRRAAADATVRTDRAGG